MITKDQSDDLYIHVSLQLTVTAGSYPCWNDPEGRSSVEFRIPIDFFEGKKLTEWLEKNIPVARREYIVKKTEAEAKAKQKEKEKEEA